MERVANLYDPLGWLREKALSLMGAISDYLEAAWLNTFRGTSFSVPAGGVHVALFTAAPGEAAGGTEVSGGAYARQNVAQAGWNAPTQVGQTADETILANTSTITYPTATANWGTVVAVGIFDTSVGGNLLYFGNLTTSKTVNTGDTFKFNAADLKLTLA